MEKRVVQTVAWQQRFDTVSSVKIICAWCNAKMGGRGTELSHGICRTCFVLMLQPQFSFMEVIALLAQEETQTGRGGTRRLHPPGRQQQPFLSLF